MTQFDVRHPSPRRLRAFSLGRVAGRRLSRISAHLNRCPHCRDWLECDALRAQERDPFVLELRAAVDASDQETDDPELHRQAVQACRNVCRRSWLISSRPQRTPLPCPDRIGSYDLISEVGRGGMGVVYKAWDRERSRLVALKAPLLHGGPRKRDRARLRLEAELAAAVVHPNIAVVHEIAVRGAWPFLAMEWADGGSLDDALGDAPWSPSRSARLIRTLCLAVNELHRRRIVHCDLKPSNILMRSVPRSIPRERIPIIADFGMARRLQAIPDSSRIHRAGGTPEYMAPEQAVDDSMRIGPATDIYALGVMLRQLLAGRPPSDRSLESDRLGDMEPIIRDATATDPAARYASGSAFADALRPFLDVEDDR